MLLLELCLYHLKKYVIKWCINMMYDDADDKTGNIYNIYTETATQQLNIDQYTFIFDSEI